MAAKILANLIIMGSGILARSLVQAYRQALQTAMLSGSSVRLLYEASQMKPQPKEILPFFVARTLQDASKTGVAQETIQNTIRRGSKTMVEQEARQVLGVTESSSWEEIMQKYDTLFERNAKNGSFYLQSKVHKAKECLEAVYQGKGQGPG